MLRDLFSLFPAYAGVILRVHRAATVHESFPRICGGDPMVTSEMRSSYAFSSHMRG